MISTLRMGITTEKMRKRQLNQRVKKQKTRRRRRKRRSKNLKSQSSLKPLLRKIGFPRRISHGILI
jgi:hypothetical protein